MQCFYHPEPWNFMPNRRICGTFAQQHKTIQAGTAVLFLWKRELRVLFFLMKHLLVLHRRPVGWLMELKWLETSYFLLFPFLFFSLGEFLYRSPLWIHSTPGSWTLEQQKGGRGREEQDHTNFIPDFYKLPGDCTPWPQWWSWGQKIVWIPVYYLVEIVCHLVVCWPPTNINVKNSKALEDIIIKKSLYHICSPMCKNLYKYIGKMKRLLQNVLPLEWTFHGDKQQKLAHNQGEIQRHVRNTLFVIFLSFISLCYSYFIEVSWPNLLHHFLQVCPPKSAHYIEIMRELGGFCVWGWGGCQGAARASCSSMEDVLGAKHNTKLVKAVTSPTRSQDVERQARVKTGLRDSGQGQTQSSGDPAGPQWWGRSEAKPGCQVGKSRLGPDSRRCETVQTELLHSCTGAQARAIAKPQLESGSEGKGEAGPHY